MIDIKVTEFFSITCDTRNWIVVKTSSKKNEQGEMVHTDRQVAFHSKFEDSIGYILKQRIKAGEAKNLIEFQLVVDDAVKEIKKVVSKLDYPVKK